MRTDFVAGQRVQVIGSYVFGMPGEWSSATVVSVCGAEIEVSFSNGVRWVAVVGEVR